MVGGKLDAHDRAVPRDDRRVTRLSRVNTRMLAGLRRPAEPPTLPPPDPYDFSLVLGGPLYQLVRRAHLSDDALHLVRRRVVVLTGLAWLPLLVLSMVEGQVWGGVAVPFLSDLEAQVRFLVTLPLLVIAELVVHERMRPVVRQFLERGLVAPRSLAQFDAAVRSAVRLRNSALVEVLLVVAVYFVSFTLWPLYAGLAVPTWYAQPTTDGRALSAAGWWFACVSLPLFQFLLARWYFRLFIWTRFLWQVGACRLSLVPTHPDRVGGLGFLSVIVVAFAPLLVAHGTLLAAFIGSRIAYQGARLTEFAIELVVVVVALLLVVLGPLLRFASHLEEARRFGLFEYGVLAQRYVREFDDKWLRRGGVDGAALVGSADVQSLADLGASFDVVSTMRVAPFTLRTIVQLAVITLLPVAPLLLTMVPLDQLLLRLLQAIF